MARAKSGSRARVGSGARSAALERKLASRGNVRDPGALAASIGRKKYGKARFQKMAAAGRRKHARRGK